MKFHQLGLIDYDENHTMTHKLVKEILSQTTSRELILVIQAYWRIWKSLDQEIRHIEQELKKQAETDPNEPTYRSVPGVGFFLKNCLISLSIESSATEDILATILLNKGLP